MEAKNAGIATATARLFNEKMCKFNHQMAGQTQTLLVYLLFIGSYSLAHSQVSATLDFEENDWEEVLRIAKQDHGIIFLDAYTTWCTPCREMDKKVFTSYRLGKFFNEHFVNAKMDMEKSLGPALAIRYDINIFPSFIFMTSDGTVINKTTGYQSINELMNSAHAAIDPSKHLLAWQKRYADGDRHPDFMYNYFMANYRKMDGSHEPLINEYFISQKDWSTPINIELLFEIVDNAGDPKFDYLLDNRDRFIEILGIDKVEQQIHILFSNKLYNSVPEISFEDAKILYDKVYKDEADYLFRKFKIKRLFDDEKYEEYAKSWIEYEKHYPITDEGQLNLMAWKFYEVVDDEKYLQHAIGWAESSVQISPSYYNYDTMAALYYKLRNKRKAKKCAKKAIKLAKKNAIDPKESLELLDKIKLL